MDCSVKSYSHQNDTSSISMWKWELHMELIFRWKQPRFRKFCRHASIHHIIQATDSHLLQVFLGQQSFPASATSFIIWLGHFPEELHSTDNKSPIMKSYTIRYCITIMQHWQGHNHFCKLVPTSTSVYICMHASAHTYLLVKLWDKVFMTSLSSAQEGIGLNCYFQTPSLWQFGTIILQIK